MISNDQISFSPRDLDDLAAPAAFRAARQLFRGDPRASDRARAVCEWCADHGARILYPGHEDYPVDFMRLQNPPPFLSSIGGTPWKESGCISIVGSREPTPASLSWMEMHLPDFVRRTRAVVVSGGARGIDQSAHAIAFRAGRPTVVFLPSGLAQPYPDEWSEWKDEVVAAGGTLLSTYAPDQQIRRSHFEERNRLIAAIGKMVFVVEARRRSGSSMTARLASEMGRTMCVLPSFPGNARTAGTLDLLFDGALAIRDGADLDALFGLCTFETNRAGTNARRAGD